MRTVAEAIRRFNATRVERGPYDGMFIHEMALDLLEDFVDARTRGKNYSAPAVKAARERITLLKGRSCTK